MSRLIKSQWSSCVSSDRKVISIKTVNTMDPTLNLQEYKAKSPFELVEEARKEAEEILHQAKAERDNLIDQVQQERQAWIKERKLLEDAAQKEGYQHGWAEGKQQGYSEYLGHLEEAKKIILSAKSDYDAYLDTSEKTILDLAVKIAEKIMDYKIDENIEYFLSLVKNAIKEVKEHQNVQIYINPVQYPSIMDRKEELITEFPQQVDLLICPDNEVPMDGCIIESDYGRIDASVDTQLSEIKRKLREFLEREFE